MSENKIESKFKFAKTVEIEGVKYNLQKLPVRQGLELRKRSRTGGDIDDIKFYEEILEHIVVEPKLSLDDFEDIGHMEKLMEKVIEYQYKGK